VQKTRFHFALATAAVLTLASLTGCAVGGAEHADTKASAASKPTDAPVQSNPLQKKLGEVVTYEDGLSVSVSQPAPYTPSAEAAGVQAGGTNVVFNVVITNNSKKNVEIGGFPSVNSGGAAASSITDMGANVGLPPSTTLLPTQKITFQDAYSVKDQADITYLITPGIGYKQAIFTSK
jgi:hypothetical protein